MYLPFKLNTQKVMTHTIIESGRETLNCVPLGQEIDSELRDVLQAPEFRAELTEIAEQQEYANVRAHDDLETGRAAERAVQEIGCASCLLADVCVINETLTGKAEAGAEHEAFMDKAVMLASAPKWLTAARISRAGIDGASLVEKLKGSVEEQDEAINQAPLEDLVGGVENHIADEVTKDQIPILASHTKIAPDAKLEIHDVSTAAGNYRVVDASAAVGFKGANLDAASYGVLSNKLLARMEEVDSTGQPQIFTADNKMQKVISKQGDSTLFELRMNGKNRMYLWVTHGKQEGDPNEVVILGSHGGDESTQRAFINNYSR